MDFNNFMLAHGGRGGGSQDQPGDAAKGIFASQLAHTGQAFQTACPSFVWAQSLLTAGGALLTNAKPAGIDSLGTISVFGHTANVPGALFSAGKGGRGG